MLRSADNLCDLVIQRGYSGNVQTVPVQPIFRMAQLFPDYAVVQVFLSRDIQRSRMINPFFGVSSTPLLNVADNQKIRLVFQRVKRWLTVGWKENKEIYGLVIFLVLTIVKNVSISARFMLFLLVHLLFIFHSL